MPFGLADFQQTFVDTTVDELEKDLYNEMGNYVHLMTSLTENPAYEGKAIASFAQASKERIEALEFRIKARKHYDAHPGLF